MRVSGGMTVYRDDVGIVVVAPPGFVPGSSREPALVLVPKYYCNCIFGARPALREHGKHGDLHTCILPLR